MKIIEKINLKIKKIFLLTFMLVTFVNSFSVFAVNIDDNNLGKYRIYCTEDTEHYIKYNDSE